jgi:hypothetical protein
VILQRRLGRGSDPKERRTAAARLRPDSSLKALLSRHDERTLRTDEFEHHFG